MFPSVRSLVISNGTTEWFREKSNATSLEMEHILRLWRSKRLTAAGMSKSTGNESSIWMMIFVTTWFESLREEKVLMWLLAGSSLIVLLDFKVKPSPTKRYTSGSMQAKEETLVCITSSAQAGQEGRSIVLERSERPIFQAVYQFMKGLDISRSEEKLAIGKQTVWCSKNNERDCLSSMKERRGIWWYIVFQTVQLRRRNKP